MKSVNRSGAKGDIEKLDVAQKSAKNSFPSETEVQPSISHSLGDKGELAGLAAYQIGPLDNDNRDKEGALSMSKSLLRNVADTFEFNIARLDRKECSFRKFKAGVGTTDGAHVFKLESISQPRKDRWIKTVVVQHNKVGEEPGNGLDNTNLKIREDNQLGGDKSVSVHITRRLAHDVGFFVFICEGNGGNHVSSKIDAQNKNSGQRKGHLDEDEEQKG